MVATGGVLDGENRCCISVGARWLSAIWLFRVELLAPSAETNSSCTQQRKHAAAAHSVAVFTIHVGVLLREKHSLSLLKTQSNYIKILSNELLFHLI